MEALVVFILTTAIFTLSIFIIFKDDINKSFESIFGTFFFVGLLNFVISSLAFSATYQAYMPYVYSHTETKELVSVRNDKDITGSFIFGSGSFESSNYYVGYTNTDKGIKQVKFDADNTYIREFIPGTEKARAEYNYCIIKKNWFYKYFVLLKLKNNIGLSEVILNVPSGTVVYQMRIE